MNDINLEKKHREAGIEFAMQLIKKLPTDDTLALECHLTGVLIVFWGALWGTFGDEYATGFIEAQLRGMKSSAPPETYTKPPMQ